MDREQWKKANPGLGLFRSEEDLAEQLQQGQPFAFDGGYEPKSITQLPNFVGAASICA